MLLLIFARILELPQGQITRCDFTLILAIALTHIVAVA